MANNRIYWALQQVGFAPDGSSIYQSAHGLDSIGITTNYNLEPAFELGQLALYQNLENIPDVQIDITKKLDGYSPVYCLATQGAVDPTLAGRANAKTTLAMSLFADTQNSSSGTPIAQLVCSGLFTSSIAYQFGTTGFFTENISLLGTSKVWTSSPQYTFSGQFLANNDQPVAISMGAGGVQRRQNLIFAGPATATDSNGSINAQHGTTRCTVLPQDIPGISASGTNDQTNGVYGTHVMSINVSANLGREPLYELGRRFYYFRYVQFPVQVSTDIEVIATTGDLIGVTEAGVAGSGLNLLPRTIKVATQDGLFLDMGTNNKLSSINQGGASTGGENMTITYSYVGYDALNVFHLNDPSQF